MANVVALVPEEPPHYLARLQSSRPPSTGIYVHQQRQGGLNMFEIRARFSMVSIPVELRQDEVEMAEVPGFNAGDMP